jgi:8-oxo-dGTP pyrophosphatase MutT (NUDIX family)
MNPRVDYEARYQAKPRAKAVLAVYLILQDNLEGVLIARRCNTGYQDGMYNFPSGHIEEGESPLEALYREVEEELGKAIADELRANPPYFRHVSHRPKHDQTGDRVDFYFVHETCKSKEKVVNGEPDKCDELRWVYLNEPLPENFVAHNRVAFNKIYGKEGARDEPGVSEYSELSLDWLKARGLYKL